MSILRGARSVTGLYRGALDVVKVYRGARIVWEKESPGVDTGLGWEANPDYLIYDTGYYLGNANYGGGSGDNWYRRRYTKASNGWAVAAWGINAFRNSHGPMTGPIVISTEPANTSTRVTGSSWVHTYNTTVYYLGRNWYVNVDWNWYTNDFHPIQSIPNVPVVAAGKQLSLQNFAIEVLRAAGVREAGEPVEPDDPVPPPATVVLTAIGISALPEKLIYAPGETLDLSGLAVFAEYSDGSTADVTASCVCNPADGAALSASDVQAVTVSYTEDGATKTTSFQVNFSFTSLEYIQSSGTQWIDSGITGNQNTDFDVRYMPVSSSQSCFAFGARQGMQNTSLCVGWDVGTGKCFADRNNTRYAMQNTGIGITVEAALTGRVLEQNGTAVYTFPADTFTAPGTIVLFSVRTAGTVSMSLAGVRIYRCRFWKNGALVRDFRPARDSNDVVCLYDAVSNSYFYNCGTGDFTAGPGTAVFQSIAVSTLPKNVIYEVGDSFDPTGMIIRATYADGSTVNVTDLCEVSVSGGEVFSETGHKVVTVRYFEEGAAATAQFVISASDRQAGPSRAEFVLTSSLTQNIYLTQSEANGVSVDWGDGSEAEAVAETSANLSHTYALKGGYIVYLTAGNGVAWSPGATIQSVNSNNETVTTVYGFLGEFNITQGMKGITVTEYPQLKAFEFGEGTILSHQKALAGASSLLSISIPPDTVSIPDYAFAGCTKLETVIVPASVVSVGDYAFDRCAKYDFVALAGRLTSIGNYAFEYCTSDEIYIELHAASIGYGAFGYCTNLRRIWLRDTVQNLGVYAKTNTKGEVTEYVGPFNHCQASLVLYAECAEADKPAGWAAHYNVYSGTTDTLLVVWQQSSEPEVSLDLVWNAHGRCLTFRDADGEEIGYDYDAQNQKLTIY